jgi:hypothetical protein
VIVAICKTIPAYRGIPAGKQNGNFTALSAAEPALAFLGDSGGITGWF